MSDEKHIPDFEKMEILFRRQYKPLRAYAFRFVRDLSLAEDIVQDVFFKLWQQRETIRFEDESVKAYLFKAVYTHSLNVLNKKTLYVHSLDSEMEPDFLDEYLSSSAMNSEQTLLFKELEEEIVTFLDHLPAQCHKIFLLSRSYGLKNREIAEQLGISIKAVEKQISKALFTLREHLLKKGLLSLFILILGTSLSSQENTSEPPCISMHSLF